MLNSKAGQDLMKELGEMSPSAGTALPLGWQTAAEAQGSGSSRCCSITSVVEGITWCSRTLGVLPTPFASDQDTWMVCRKARYREQPRIAVQSPNMGLIGILLLCP